MVFFLDSGDRKNSRKAYQKKPRSPKSSKAKPRDNERKTKNVNSKWHGDKDNYKLHRPLRNDLR